MRLDFLREHAYVLAEKVITHAARKKNEQYLRFFPSTSLSVPRRTGNVPTLLYVHVPFCEELCPYCSFNRVTFQEDVARPYFGALRKEILMYRDLGYDFKALYVGGGTPTILMDELAETIRVIKSVYSIGEISIETNPNHLTPGNLDVLKSIGVNRLSVGVQTFDDNLLKTLNRYHKYGSGQEISERLAHAQGIFHTLNVDLMFNFPRQTMEMLDKDLASIISIGVDQITYYPLMSSSRTQEKMQRDLGGVSYSRGREFYTRLAETLASHYKATTAWCFSRNDTMIDEYAVNYEEYAGLGSGAIGHIGGSAYANTFDIEAYIRKVNAGVLPIAAKRDFSMRERLCYEFLMKLFGLRLNLSSVNAKHGVNMYYQLWPEILFFRLVRGLTKEGDELALTKRGQYYWLLMMSEFFIGVNNFRDYCRAQTDANREIA
ncbi:MAG TPA: coproporphyrinogen III oxidase family protein [Dissulfurispiraceae bacterium]|nr:coproporphyrinogen III oxidase family protein [Dissulfurispiraceae bacterium]